MGLEVYLQSFGATEKTSLSVDGIRALFPVDQTKSEPLFWTVRYDSVNSCHIGISLLPENGSQLKSLYVERPCSDVRLWDALFAILKMGQVVLFFPGGPLIVEQQADEKGLAAEMMETLGPPVRVDCGESLRRIVGK